MGFKSRLLGFLGPPAAFLKMLLGMSCALLGTYVNALSELRPTVIDLLGRAVMLGLLGGAIIAFVLFVVWAILDGWRSDTRDRVGAAITLLLGVFVIDALVQLASTDKTAYLETFVSALTAVLVALTVEARIFGNRGDREVKTPTEEGQPM